MGRIPCILEGRQTHRFLDASQAQEKAGLRAPGQQDIKPLGVVREIIGKPRGRVFGCVAFLTVLERGREGWPATRLHRTYTKTSPLGRTAKRCCP
ncbi:hypothetical protein CCZ27_22810 (plasmid) [Thauera sinica]|nr:hypothetical protein CCZ27_22810 [Thauera sp. K11]